MGDWWCKIIHQILPVIWFPRYIGGFQKMPLTHPIITKELCPIRSQKKKKKDLRFRVIIYKQSISGNIRDKITFVSELVCLLTEWSFKINKMLKIMSNISVYTQTHGQGLTCSFWWSRVESPHSSGPLSSQSLLLPSEH